MKNVEPEVKYGGIMPHVETKKSDTRKKGDGIAKKSKRKKWKKPKDKPNRPLSAYNIFFRDERKKLMAGGGGLSIDKKVGFAALARHISTKWKSLDEDSKKAYKIPANLEQIRYKLELAEWRKKQSMTKKDDADSEVCSSKEVNDVRNQEELTLVPIESTPEVGQEIPPENGSVGRQEQSFSTVKEETYHEADEEEHYRKNNEESVETSEDIVMTEAPLQSHSELSKACSPVTELTSTPEVVSEKVESSSDFAQKQDARASLGVLIEAMEKRNAESSENERIEDKAPSTSCQQSSEHTQEAKHVDATAILPRQLVEQAIYESQYVSAYQWMKNQQQQSSLISLIKIMKDMEQEKEEAVNQVILLREEVQRLRKELSLINPQNQHRNERIIGNTFTFRRPTDIYIDPKNVTPAIPVTSNPDVLNRA